MHGACIMLVMTMIVVVATAVKQQAKKSILNKPWMTIKSANNPFLPEANRFNIQQRDSAQKPMVLIKNSLNKKRAPNYIFTLIFQ
jgi:hypothetical protein